MYMSGVQIGTVRIRLQHKRIRRGPLVVRIACFVAALGTTTPSIRVSTIAASGIPTIVAAIWGSASSSSRSLVAFHSVFLTLSWAHWQITSAKVNSGLWLESF
jgi:hypothetical protein